ncbi:MAG: DNA recombination protein RmuC, partial [Clostridia bacterium]
YIRVPHTTDFAVLFLPIEGLYAEALRRPALQNKLHTQYRVLLSGPATLSALLNSLQMGFKTLAVEQRSEEIWRLLGAVRGEFLKFGEALDRTRQRLDLAGQDLDAASTRTRQITRQLAKVEEMPVPNDWKG